MTDIENNKQQRISIRFEEGTDFRTLNSIDGSTINDVPLSSTRRRSIDAYEQKLGIFADRKN
jgi:hypothetical protein